MEGQTLIFNLDDTLIECNKYFKATIDEFTRQLQQWFPSLSKEEIQKVQLDLDMKAIETHGLDSSRFPESLASTYKYFSEQSGRDIQAEELDVVRGIGKSVFEIEVEPLPHIYEVLEELREEGHQLYLFTGGDEENQSRKIAQLELEKYFGNRVYIYTHKDAKALGSILDSIGANKNSTWMIGNSLKTDIKPAVELGITAVHIPSELEWSFNNEVDVTSIGTFMNLKSLTELPELIRKGTRKHEAI